MTSRIYCSIARSEGIDVVIWSRDDHRAGVDIYEPITARSSDGIILTGVATCHI